MARICYGCFKEYGEAERQCPYCGYNSETDREKYPLALPNGTLLGGHYKLGKVLGQGGFGITYLAQDLKKRTLVAIKEYFPDTLVTRNNTLAVRATTADKIDNFDYGKTLFLQEARTLALLKHHSNIVKIFEYFEENGTAYFSMEYISGVNFEEYIANHGGKISFDEAISILCPVMDALSEVHSHGLVHRDIAPDNIRIADDGTVKLIDFGAARYSVGDVTKSLEVLLKHGFAPIEQYSKHGKQGPFTDVYALSATLYYAITGKRPLESTARFEDDFLFLPSALGADIGASQEDALMRGLAVRSQDRYQTIRELQEAFQQDPNAWKEEAYSHACELLKKKTIEDYLEAKTTFSGIPGYREADELAKQCELEIQRITSRKKKRVAVWIGTCLGISSVVMFVVFFIFRGEIPFTARTKQEYSSDNVIHKSESGSVIDSSEIESYHTHIESEAVIENRVNPECEIEGQYDEVTYCSICGEEIKRNTIFIPALGHDWSEWRILREPTETEMGERIRFCERDSTHQQTEAIPVREYHQVETDPIAIRQELLSLLLEIEQEQPEAMKKIGDCFFDGYGVEQNYREALYWYLKAIESGNTDAMLKVSVCFEEGFGIEKNQYMADYWRDRASMN